MKHIRYILLCVFVLPFEITGNTRTYLVRCSSCYVSLNQMYSVKVQIVACHKLIEWWASISIMKSAAFPAQMYTWHIWCHAMQDSSVLFSVIVSNEIRVHIFKIFGFTINISVYLYLFIPHTVQNQIMIDKAASTIGLICAYCSVLLFSTCAFLSL